MKYQDIHLEDKSLLESFRQAWGVGDYAGAFAILQQTQLADKQLIADTLNYGKQKLLRNSQTQRSKKIKSKLPSRRQQD